MVSGDMNNDGDDELVVALTSATAGSGSQAEVFRVDSATCFRLACLELVGSFAFVLPSGPTVSASAAAVLAGVVDSSTTTTTTTTGSAEYSQTTTRSPEIKLAIGTNALSRFFVLCCCCSLCFALRFLVPSRPDEELGLLI
jgi:hypothetical protein